MNHYSIKYVEDKKAPDKWPARVEKIFESYREASKHLAKSITGHDNIQKGNFQILYNPATEDLLERIWKERAAQNPQSIRTTVTAVYRVKKLRNEEFYFYNCFKTANNRFNEPVEPYDNQYSIDT